MNWTRWLLVPNVVPTHDYSSIIGQSPCRNRQLIWWGLKFLSLAWYFSDKANYGADRVVIHCPAAGQAVAVTANKARAVAIIFR